MLNTCFKTFSEGCEGFIYLSFYHSYLLILYFFTSLVEIFAVDTSNLSLILKLIVTNQYSINNGKRKKLARIKTANMYNTSTTYCTEYTLHMHKLCKTDQSLINSLTFIPYRPKIGVRNETILVWYLGIKIIISFKCSLS